MPNFKKLTKQYRSNAAIALQQFVRINSVYDPTTIGPDAPFGKGVQKALDYVAKLGNDYGFKVDKCDGYCTELTVGEEGPIIGIYAHSDVVPVSGKWEHEPFGGMLKDGRFWGRGTCDDKGPLIASLFAMKALRDAGLVKGYRIRLVSGGDEERGSSCLAYYFEHLKKPHSDFGFTPDADWPLIYGEKAIRRYELRLNGSLEPIIAMDGGVVANAVCDKFVVTLPKDKGFLAYLKEKNIPADISDAGTVSVISFRGKSAHGSTPHEGTNAAAIALKAIGEYFKKDNLARIGDIFASGDGAVWGGQSHSAELLDATYNYGVIHYDGKKLTSSLDFRFGEEADPDALIAKLCAASGFEAKKLSDAPALLFDKKSPLVSTLMKVYRKEFRQPFAKPFTIGGGTYAKEAKNCVAFGAASKEHPGNMHSPDEYIYQEDFYRDIAVYAHAIYALGTLKK